ncbi:MAG: hypothetical protein R6U84_06285 [Candidatus Cloacimonadales bacterium]
MKNKRSVEFKKIPINASYGEVINDVYLVIENGKCKVLDSLNSLETDKKDEIIVIISNMATIKNFRSKKIRYLLKKYSYGEIKPFGHRVFFFKKCGNNIILFDYKTKKKGSLGDSVYKQIEKEKIYYEQEFRKYYK